MLGNQLVQNRQVELYVREEQTFKVGQGLFDDGLLLTEQALGLGRRKRKLFDGKCLVNQVTLFLNAFLISLVLRNDLLDGRLAALYKLRQQLVCRASCGFTTGLLDRLINLGFGRLRIFYD